MVVFMGVCLDRISFNFLYPVELVYALHVLFLVCRNSKVDDLL